MEVKRWTYEEFPDYTQTPEGAHRIPTTGEEVSVLYTHDAEYANVDGISLSVRILRPVARDSWNRKLPCLVFVPGSAWMKQDTKLVLPNLSEIARRGYVVAAVQYRHSGQAHFPAQIADTKNAIRFLRMNAEKFGVLPDKIAAAGDSSGGHVAMFCGIAADDGPLDDNLYPGVSAAVCGVIDYYGAVTLMMPDGNPTTLNHKLPESPEGMLMGANLREHPEIAARGSCVTYITPSLPLPPCCILHGTKDMVVNVKQSVELYEKLRACGKEAELWLLEGANHGGGEFFTPAAVDVADRFLRRCFGLKDPV